MKLSPRKINTYLFFKLPSAYITKVKHKWINQNPFKSMFWAVQGMAAELSTGALVMEKINSSQQNISMLVASNRATFHKKARGRITFKCEEGKEVMEAIQKAVETGEGQTIWMKSGGRDAEGDLVSEFEFQWTLKTR